MKRAFDHTHFRQSSQTRWANKGNFQTCQDPDAQGSIFVAIIKDDVRDAEVGRYISESVC